MEPQQYVISFDNLSPAEAAQYAGELRDRLLDTSPNVSVEFERDAQNTMDFGATLILMLGTPAVIAVADGIRRWLSSRPTAQISVKTRHGEVLITGLTSADAAKVGPDKIVEALQLGK